MRPYQMGGDMIEVVGDEETTWNVLPHKFEAGTPNVADAVGLAAACNYLESLGMDAVRTHEVGLLELAVDPEDLPAARLALTGLLDGLAARGLAATGQILHSVGDHAAAGRVLAQHADEVQARAVAVGRSPRGPATQFAEGSFTSALTHASARTVVLVQPGQTPHQLNADVLAGLRGA